MKNVGDLQTSKREECDETAVNMNNNEDMDWATVKFELNTTESDIDSCEHN